MTYGVGRPAHVGVLTLASACLVVLSMQCGARRPAVAERTKVPEPNVGVAGVEATPPACEQRRLPELVMGDNFGVNIHGAGARDFELIAEAGFKFVRIDLTWQVVEQSRGQYDWSPYEGLIEQLRARKLRPFFILSYSNPLYEQEVEVKHGERALRKPAAPAGGLGREAFAAFAAEAARHFAADEAVFEIWNEPDLDTFWPPRASVADYLALAGSACQSLRAVNPSALVVGPGAAKVPTREQPKPEFLNGVLRSRLVDCLDAISVHPYVHIAELANSSQNWQLLRTLIAATTTDRPKRMPLLPISSESGLSTGGGGYLHGPPSESEQAFYAVRMLLHNFANGIPISIWYDWKDDGEDAADAENRFGLVRRDLALKPAYQAVRTMSHELRGLRLSCAGHERDRTFLMFGDEGTRMKLASWSDVPDATALDLPLAASVERIVDMYGRTVPYDPSLGAPQSEVSGVSYATLGKRDADRFCAQLARQP